MNLRRRTVKNAFNAAFFHIGSTVAVLAATPFMLTALGLEGYGFWALLNASSKYVGAADFGISSSLTRFVASFAESNERERIRQVLTFGTFLYLGLLLLVIPFAIHFSWQLAGRAHLKGTLASQAPILLATFIICFFVQLLAGAFSAVVTGLGRLALTARCNAIGQVLFVAVTLVLLVLHQGLLSLAYGLLAQSLSILIIAFVLARRLNGPLFSFAPLDRATMKAFVSNGGWVQLTTLMVIVYAESDQIIIAALLGLKISALYDVGSKLARAVRALSFYLTSALMPTVAALHAKSGTQATIARFADGLRFAGLATFYVAGALFVLAPSVVFFWIGARPGIEIIIPIVRFLVIVFVIDNTVALGATLMRGLALPKLETGYTVVNAVCNVGLMLVLAKPLGVLGVNLAMLGGTSIGAIVFYTIFMKRFAVSPAMLMPLLRLFVFVAPCVAIGGYLEFRYLHHAMPNRATALMESLVGTICYTAAFAVAVRASRILRFSDRLNLQNGLPRRLASILDLRFVRALFA